MTKFRFQTWIIFTIIFAFAENVPTTKPRISHNYDVTEHVANVIAKTFEVFDSMFHENSENNTKNDSTTITRSDWIKLPSGLTNSYNITMKVESSPKFKGRILVRENATIICEMISIVLKAYPLPLENDLYIATEEIYLNLTLSIPMNMKKSNRPGDEMLISVDYHDLDNYNIDLYSNYYHFKKNERDELKHEFKSRIKKMIYEESNGDWKHVIMLIVFGYYEAFSEKKFMTATHGDFLEHEQKYYWFMKTIASENFTLRNVTIKGLWNFHSMSVDYTNPEDFLVLVSSDVHGTVTQIFTPELAAEQIVPLRFKANNLYISKDRNANKTHVKAEEYSVINTVSKNSLSREQSRLVIEAIEWAIATRIPKIAKKLKP
ncbi:uncharacterized protein LOC135837279 [Planococcus citri]|uniref:uncharacterized protein LOC135837279 n=1 Tax=Planococcus citri TaxID=170843 RepID=UPI0031F8483E